MPQPLAYEDAPAAVRAIYDDIMRTRAITQPNNFWLYLGNDPTTLERTWTSLKAVMAPGALDTLTKELIYLAVSVANNCEYGIASHSVAAAKVGMSAGAFAELMAVVGMSSETNRLAAGWRVPVDAALA